MAVHQFVPMLHLSDAVGRHTLELRDLLRAGGVESDIYVELVDPETEAITKLASAYHGATRGNDVLVYQFATASDLTGLLAARGESLVVNYHNITPPECFAPWDNPLARHQVRAQGELRILAPRAALGVAVSEFNRADLVAAGYHRTAVVPPIVHLEPRPAAAANGAGATGTKWLSVGRLAPNKAVEDTLEALLCFRQTYDPGASLRVIGRPSLTLYAQALHRFSAELGLADAVTFEERLSDEALADAYQEADVLVVLSAHEGFCLPVVEAMAQGLAVVAWARGALPEVLGDGGLLIEDKSPASVAGAVQRLRTDPRLADQLSQSAARRVADLGIESSGPRLVRLLSALHDGTVLPDDVGLEPPGGTTRSGL